MTRESRFRAYRAILLVLLSSLAARSSAQNAEPAPPGAPAQESLFEAQPPGTFLEDLDRFAREHPSLARLEEAGRSREGRPLLLLTLAAQGGAPIAERPSILLVAGLEGTDALGPWLVMQHLRRLAAAQASGDDAVRALLREHVILAVPLANPDGAAARWESPSVEQRGNGRPQDDDHDGRVDEDGPRDLDGDGVIAQMRVRDPEGTWILDPADARVLRPARPEKGERGEWRLLSEGLDDDGDGEVNEDPVGDALPDRNFPSRWEEHHLGTGRFPSSEPETRALLDLVLSHPSIALAVIYGEGDDVAQTPKAEKGKGYGKEGRASQDPAGPLEADHGILERWGKRYREIAKAPLEGRAMAEGSLAAWLYAERGVPVAEIRGWTIPEKDAAAKPEAASQPVEASPPGETSGVKSGKALEEKEAEGEKKKEEKGEKEKPAEDLRALRWIDRHRGGKGFVAWHPFPHPTLGDVEIGGFAAFSRADPTPETAASILEERHEFLLWLGTLLPRVRVASLESHDRGGGVWELEARVTNEGELPTATAMGVKSRAVRPVRVELDLPDGASLLAGERRVLVPSLAGLGGTETVRWVFHAASSWSATVRATSEKGGRDEASLGGNAGEDETPTAPGGAKAGRKETGS